MTKKFFLIVHLSWSILKLGCMCYTQWTDGNGWNTCCVYDVKNLSVSDRGVNANIPAA